MKIEKDASGNSYVEVDNIRLTYVPDRRRPNEKKWVGSDVIRIQAYRGNGKSLYMGGEFPVKSDEQVVEFIHGMTHLVKNKG